MNLKSVKTLAAVAATAVALGARAEAPAGEHWIYVNKVISNTVSHVMLNVTVANVTNLTLSSVKAWNGSTEVDLSKPIWSADYTTEYAFVSIGKVFQNNETLTRIVLPPTVTSLVLNAFNGCKTVKEIVLTDAITSFDSSFANCTSLTNVTPFLPAGFTKFNKANCFGTCTSLSNSVLRLSNPGLTYIEYNSFGNLHLVSVDMTGSGVKSMGGQAFGKSSVTNVIFPVGFQSVDNANAFGSLRNNTLYFRFLGGPPSSGLGGATYTTCFIPRWSTEWTDSPLATYSAMSATDRTNYEAHFPGERLTGKKVKLGTTAYYLGYWYPYEPPSGVEIDYTEAALAEKATPTATATGDASGEGLPTWNLFDGNAVTTTEGKRWLCGANGSVTYSLPEGAKIARGLQFTSYTLTKLTCGDKAAERAPTAWKLEGSKDGQAWTVLDAVDLAGTPEYDWPAASLTRPVADEFQKAYSHFRFTPLGSASSGAGGDDWPYGLMELAFTGMRVTSGPTVGEAVFAEAGWESLDFSATVLNKGNDLARDREATTVNGRVELSDSDDFATVAAMSSVRTFEEGVAQTLTVTGLKGATPYYARFIAENDLDAATTNMIGAVSTLSEPFVIGAVTSAEAGNGAYAVTVDLTQLYAGPVTVTLRYGALPETAGETFVASVNRSEAGSFTFEAFTPSSPKSYAKVTVAVTADQQVYEASRTVPVSEFWLLGADKTSMTNSLTGVAFGLTAGGEGFTISSLKTPTLVDKVNLRRPVYDEEGTEYVITGIGDVFDGNVYLHELDFPDTITRLNLTCRNAINLRRVQLSGKLESIVGAAFLGCTSLTTVQPLFPATFTNLSGQAFNGCTKLTNEVICLSRKLTALSYSAFNNTQVPNLDLGKSGIATLEGSWFNGMGSLTNITFGKEFRSFGDAAFRTEWTKLGSLRFCGPPPENLNAISKGVFIPRGQSVWRNYLNDHPENVTSFDARWDTDSFRKYFPDDPLPKKKLRIPSTGGWNFLMRWDSGETDGFKVMIK